MATQAAARQAQVGSSPKPKILRIGIIQGGRIVEERLVRKRENITIGQSAKNMFVVPSDALPRNWLLFEASGNQYVAHFSDGMDARIAVGNEIISLSQLKQTGKIQKRGTSWPLPLDERSRGKISLADMTILFQFVTPPPPQPRPQLPASVRGSALTGMDWFFTTIAAISFLVHLSLILYLRSVDWPRKPDIEEVPDRFVKMVTEKKPEEKKPEVKKTEEKKDEKKAEEKKKAVAEEKKQQAAPKKELSEEEKAKLAEEKARADAERRARLAEQVKSTGLLKLLGARADGEGSIADVLGKGDVDRDQEKAFQGVGGVGVANSNDQLRGIKSGGSGTGRVASASGLRGGGSIEGGGTGEAKAEKKVSGVVKSEAPAVDGELDPAMVAKEVRTRLGAIKACYERALKRNPNLSGKVVIHWTITQAGTVSGVDVEQDTLGDAEVASCIKSLVARWRFPAPSGGSVEVSFPFVFQSSQ
ncbi:MAG TPA: AgmX/PglI C-terminal domain-containing protein [Polyangia bacterium]|nr:AgmX/PglI C-terminal domain-containing protein [Polyangia bacterium]